MSKIGIFDSGCGGLSVFKEIYKLLPNEDYIYFADNANCPYGNKQEDFIIDRCRFITQYLMDRQADIIVIACNTATGAAIAGLREEFGDMIFIGMEPAVKPAALSTKTNVIGVLATEGTLKSSKYLMNKEKYEEDAEIVEQVGKGWVTLVENGILSGPEAEEKVRICVEPLVRKGADKIVLGCTHYPFLKDLIKKYAPCAEIIDPAPSVARHLFNTMNSEGINFNDVSSGKVELHASGDDAALKRMYEIAMREMQ